MVHGEFGAVDANGREVMPILLHIMKNIRENGGGGKTKSHHSHSTQCLLFIGSSQPDSRPDSVESIHYCLVLTG